MTWPPPPDVVRLDHGTLTISVQPNVGLTLTYATSAGERGRTTLPYPAGGHGGHEVVMGPGSAFALFLYSGQSEQGYELFELETLRHLGGLPYQRGEGVAPVFSPDGRLLVMAWCAGDLPYAEDEPSPRDPGEDAVPWARLVLHDVRTGQITRRQLHADLRGWRPSEGEFAGLWPEDLRFAGPHELRLLTPWGRDAVVPLPPAERIVVPGPATPA